MEFAKEWHTFFNQFQETLYTFSVSGCPGCRNFPEACNPFGNCTIHKCTIEHGVDFCADCSEFPCTKPKDVFDEKLPALPSLSKKSVCCPGRLMVANQNPQFIKLHALFRLF
ncbi:MAG: DUF3795 domain-containing protein [Hydrogeniiclostridium mannosilyticum]